MSDDADIRSRSGGFDKAGRWHDDNENEGAPERTWLAVPYEDRNQVKSLGGRWDREAKAWYVPPGRSSEQFRQWAIPDAPAEHDRIPQEQFADELHRAGFRLSGGHPVMDGRIHRIQVDGDKPGERNGSYRAFADGVPNGWYQNFKTHPEPMKWKAGAPGLTPEQRAAMKATAADKAADDRRARDLAADQAAQRAVEILSAATPAIGHAYLTAKQVKSEGLFIASPGTTIETESGKQIDIAGRLLVPIRNADGAVISLQIIDSQGGKMFLRDGRIGGGRHVIGNPASCWPVTIAEGYATAATIHEATGHTVIAVFTAHNLAPVAASIRAAHPEQSIFIAADNDHHLPLQTDAQGKPKRNVGLEAATAAAKAVDGHVLVPAFDKGAVGTDWNDARKERGMDSVRTELAAGMAAGTRIKIARDIAQGRGYGRTIERERGRDSGGRG